MISAERSLIMPQPICKAEQPAPKGEPIFPSARYAHIARPDLEHSDVETSVSVTSDGVFAEPPNEDAFRLVEHRQCKYSGGNL